MRKFFAVTIAFSLLFLGLTFGIAKAQVSHGFQDTKFAAEKPWTNIRDYGADHVWTGQDAQRDGREDDERWHRRPENCMSYLRLVASPADLSTQSRWVSRLKKRARR